jgi:hypothetical protein
VGPDFQLKTLVTDCGMVFHEAVPADLLVAFEIA